MYITEGGIEMGLDVRIMHVAPELSEDANSVIFEGNGRMTYAFLKEWVGSERYGEDIVLTKETAEELIDLAAEQMTEVYMENSESKAAYDPISEAYSLDNPYGIAEFVRVMMMVESAIAYYDRHGIPESSRGHFTVEADW